MSLAGKTIVVTGASKGLGLGVVKRLCEEKANIIAHYNSGDISEAAACAKEAGVSFTAFQADLSDPAQVMKLAKDIVACGEIYGLVNNAGVCLFEDFFDVTEESYDFTFNVNTKAVFFLTQAVAKQMVDNGVKGRIVNFSSITAHSGSATQVHYGAAKGAISAFTHMAAEALGKYGITVNAVMPGPIPTKHNSAFLALEETKKDMFERMPMKCYGQPENIADAIVYFLGERAGWTTGTTLPVDGGFLAK
ncbi:MAG: SDR family oxidoreductase [Lachnospiraceae bacterium]|nr:SDR family oxidoreductase [Candidatus Equihabitans merdae]